MDVLSKMLDFVMQIGNYMRYAHMILFQRRSLSEVPKNRLTKGKFSRFIFRKIFSQKNGLQNYGHYFRLFYWPEYKRILCRRR